MTFSFRTTLLVLLLSAVGSPALAEPVALVTGSSRGIGLALVRELAADGWKVIATCLDPKDAEADELHELHRRYPMVVVEGMDVTDPVAIDRVATKYRDLPIDLLINNAGIVGNYAKQTLDDIDARNFEQVMRVNTYGPMRVASVFLKNVERSEQKKIVTITSLLGSIGTAQASGEAARLSNAPPPARPTDTYFYRMSKAALNMGMRVMQNEVRGRGIAIGIISPGIVATDARKGRDAGPPPANLLTPAQSARAILKLAAELDTTNGGRFLEYTNDVLPW